MDKIHYLYKAFAISILVLTICPAQQPQADTTNVVVDAPADTTIPAAKDSASLFVTSLAFDTSLISGSKYGDFADILDFLPGVYHYDRGSIGQPSLVSLFSSNLNSTLITFDGLILNDPLTLAADLNLIPVQSVGFSRIIIHPPELVNGYMPSGNSIIVESKRLASLPIRSQIAWRNGYNAFDDIDVRVGIRASPVLTIDAGSVLRNYGGTVPHSRYRGWKTNLHILRQLTENWRLKYVLLMNSFDLDFPEISFAAPLFPHQKDVRYDHGLSISNKNRFTSSVQLTDLYREVYGNQRSVLDALYEANRIFWTTAFSWELGSLSLQSGVRWQLLAMESNDWGEHHRWALLGWTGVQQKLGDNLNWHAKIQMEKNRDYRPFLQPQAGLSYKLTDSTLVHFWMNYQKNVPSFQELYSKAPFFQDYDQPAPEEALQVGLALNRHTDHYDGFGSLSVNWVRNKIAAFYRIENDLPVFANMPDQLRLSLDAGLNYKWTSFFEFAIKAKLFTNHIDDPSIFLLNVPDFYAKGYIQIRHVLFKGDLNARLRIGASAYGTRIGSFSYYVNYATYGLQSGFAVVPYLHGIFVIKSATVFVSFDNPLGLEYHVVYGYDMPARLLRWGFEWNFID